MFVLKISFVTLVAAECRFDDIIYKNVKEIYNHENTTKVMISKEIIKNAQIRNILGNPPFSGGNSKGDELIFESLLSECNDDLIIVTEDNKGFTDHKQYLIEEYHSNKGKELKILNDLSSAIGSLGKEPAEEIKEFDHAMITDSFGISYPSEAEFSTDGFYISFPTGGGRVINISSKSFSKDGAVSFLDDYDKLNEFP